MKTNDMIRKWSIRAREDNTSCHYNEPRFNNCWSKKGNDDSWPGKVNEIVVINWMIWDAGLAAE